MRIRSFKIILHQRELHRNSIFPKASGWEACIGGLIKDIKKTLYKILGKTLRKPKQLEAVIINIERHLNNRPLTNVKSESEEERALT